MIRSTLRTAALAALIGAALPAHAVVSNFDTDADGWTAAGDIEGPLTWTATGGNPAGHVLIDDLTTGGVTYFVAPLAFLGKTFEDDGLDFIVDLAAHGAGA